MSSHPLYVITGPTACGKTAVSVELAKKIKGEIVSADSMLVYRGMDIGTAKPNMVERADIPHYMIDIVDPDDDFSAAQYKTLADGIIYEIHKRGVMPILTGGTGFYINAIVFGNEFYKSDESEQEYRCSLQQLAKEKGVNHLHEILAKIDPISAEQIHPNNLKRVIRAISFYRQTNTTLSQHNMKQRNNIAVYKTVFIILYMERALLYDKINQRVVDMYNNGLVDEVRGLVNKGYHDKLVSMQGIGYKETIGYLNGTSTLNETIESVQQATRNYAKRQLTWFKHRSANGIWLDVTGQTTIDIVNEILTQGVNK
jgi:tRNA dimethylallyltransferase